MDLNKITLIGSMVREPEARQLADGQTVARFSLATTCSWQDPQSKAEREAVDFHDCVAWGKLGEIVRQYVKKGARVYVEGRLRKRSFIGRDGGRRTIAEIVVENMVLVGRRSSHGESDSSPGVREDGRASEVEEGP